MSPAAQGFSAAGGICTGGGGCGRGGSHRGAASVLGLALSVTARSAQRGRRQVGGWWSARRGGGARS